MQLPVRCGCANTIRSHLHFSVPDEGPLTDFESWMPDFMSGLAEGIEKSRGMVKAAVNSVATDMVISPQMAVTDSGVMDRVRERPVVADRDSR